MPASTIDFSIKDGLKDISIEERSEDELHFIDGFNDSKAQRIRITPFESRALNYGFDITPSKYVSALITEKGICPADESGIKELFPENF